MSNTILEHDNLIFISLIHAIDLSAISNIIHTSNILHDIKVMCQLNSEESSLMTILRQVPVVLLRVGAGCNVSSITLNVNKKGHMVGTTFMLVSAEEMRYIKLLLFKGIPSISLKKERFEHRVLNYLGKRW